MSFERRSSLGNKCGFSQLIGKWVYEPVQRYFSPASREKNHGVSKPPDATQATTAGFATVVLPDGAKLKYGILGSHNLGKTIPVVVICGMTASKSDDDRVNHAVAKSHPGHTVLVYDHRGMGDSSLTPAGDEEISIELLARDLLFLLTQLKWKEVALCGHSMGGVISQQLLVLPYHLTSPAKLPFRVTHLFLVGTRCKPNQGPGLPITAVPGKPRSLDERREGARRVIAATVDPAWIEVNKSRFDQILARVVNNNLSNRPADMVAKQSQALRKFDFEQLLKHIPKDIRVLVIHGQLDQVIPFSCAEDIISRIPQARLVGEGSQFGHVPTLKFGHLWYEYFDPQVWHDVLHAFMQQEAAPSAKD
ncbi:Putative aminoacrylate hydrolase RutD [Leucoagaricus sp. SymC.cos]|nr:Putative aminoacrylate hydrolase RutD [Leucoagaricus sp. SymC.cos]